MANYHSSTGALCNLLIGLSRGYRKEYRRLMRRKNADPHKIKVELRRDFLESLTAMLEGYFPKEQTLLVAANILVMVDLFTEPPDEE